MHFNELLNLMSSSSSLVGQCVGDKILCFSVPERHSDLAADQLFLYLFTCFLLSSENKYNLPGFGGEVRERDNFCDKKLGRSYYDLVKQSCPMFLKADKVEIHLFVACVWRPVHLGAFIRSLYPKAVFKELQ